MKWSPRLLLPLACLAASVAGLQHSAIVDREGDVVVSWTPEDAANAIVIQVEARTRGWVAIGFSPAGGMAGADIVMAWVADGRTHIQDMHAIGNSAPLLDTTDNVELLEGRENDTHTVFTFRRPLRSCDTEHDIDLGMDTTRLIWAMHPSDPTPGRGPSYHADRRGTRSVSLDASGVFQYPAEGETESLFIGNTDTEIAASGTHYHCAVYKLPDLGGKVHYTGYRVKLSPDTQQYVHHLVLYECSVPSGMESFFDDYAETHPGAKCYSANMPPNWSLCQAAAIVWAIGSEGDMLPDNVGMPLGAEHGGATYFMLETHYDNPQVHSGKRDSSGLELFYTRSLRPTEAGIITTGHLVTSTQMIPPGQHRFTTSSVCSQDCTEQHLPAAGVQVHSILLHAHLAGRAITVRHIRDGKELPPLLTDKYYDFNYQQSRMIDPSVRILPGDMLLTECDYATEDRTNVTLGGFSTYNEMCLAFITYYPRTALSACGSSPHIGDYLDIMGVHQVDVNGLLLPSVSGADVWTIGGFKYEMSRLNKIGEQEPQKQGGGKAGKKPNRIGRDDWFNRAQLSTMSVSVNGETPNTTLYDYVTQMTWSQPVVDGLQREATRGRQFHRCWAGGHGSWKDYRKRYSGPHTFAKFEPFVPLERAPCAAALRGTASRRYHLSGATVALALAALRAVL